MKPKIGDIYKTNSSGLVTVLELKKCSVVKVSFLNTGYETDTRLDQLKVGQVKDKSIVQRKRNRCKKLFIITMVDGHEYKFNKLNEALEVVGETNINKLYEIARGRTIKGHQVQSIRREDIV